MTRNGKHFLAWFAGARLSVLAHCPSETTFYSALGSLVVLFALASGATWCIALGYILGVKPTSLWPVGVAWAVMIMTIERLLLSFPSTRERWWASIPPLLPRFAVSIVVGILLAEPLVLRIYQPEIDRFLAADQQAAVHRQVADVTRFYGPRIAADRQRISNMVEAERALQAQAEHYTFLRDCEAGETTCSTTHKLGCGPYCRHYAQLAATARANLRAMKARDKPEIRALNTEIGKLRAAQAREGNGAHASIDHSGGLLAREEALVAIAKLHPSVNRWIWFFRAMFLVLDLLPIVSKVTRTLFFDSPYENLNAAERKREALAGHRITLKTRRRTRRLELRTAMLEDVDRAHYDVERILRTREEEERLPQHLRPAPQQEPVAEPLGALTLGEVISTMSAHEEIPVTVPKRLRRAAWIGTALTGTLALALVLYTQLSGDTVNGSWIVYGLVGFVTALSLFTRGYRRAPGWALRGLLATLLVGLTLPIVVIALNA